VDWWPAIASPSEKPAGALESAGKGTSRNNNHRICYLNSMNLVLILYEAHEIFLRKIKYPQIVVRGFLRVGDGEMNFRISIKNFYSRGYVFPPPKKKRN
jgi:hypothetical protein